MIKDLFHFVLLCIISILTINCQNAEGIEKKQNSRNKVVSVKDNIKLIETDSILISDFSYIKVLGDYAVIPDLKSSDKLVHLFDKETMAYIASTGDLGQGPGEISSIAGVAYDNDRDCLQVVDYGSKNIYNFVVDSVKMNPDYLPTVKQKLRNDIIPYEYHFLNDTLSYGAFISLNASRSSSMRIGKWNLLTGEMQLHNHEHPATANNVVVYDYSSKHDLIVECSNKYDLINIFDGQLNLKSRIYGPEWEENGDDRQHFLSVVFYKNWIIAAYSGKRASEDRMPTICYVFDLKGNYVKTLDIGYKIWRMSVDENLSRLYFSFQDAFQFGYLDLKGLLD
ncbi:MAG: 6-bladed beta-propeller [Bacteroidaceae bacterium]|nr:6-bladed beta-propeller [Bacteroidaceae bacterium]